MNATGGQGLRAVGMLSLAALLLAGIGWGVNALVERVREELPPQQPPARAVPRPPRPARQGAPPSAAPAGRPARVSPGDARGPADEASPESAAAPANGEWTAPVAIQSPAPEYTESARQARIQGVVILEVEIDREGRVTSTRVLKGLPMGLDEEARAAVSRWRFQPATRHGDPVPAVLRLTIDFRLE